MLLSLGQKLMLSLLLVLTLMSQAMSSVQVLAMQCEMNNQPKASPLLAKNSQMHQMMGHSVSIDANRQHSSSMSDCCSDCYCQYGNCSVSVVLSNNPLPSLLIPLTSQPFIDTVHFYKITIHSLFKPPIIA